MKLRSATICEVGGGTRDGGRDVTSRAPHHVPYIILVIILVSFYVGAPSGSRAQEHVLHRTGGGGNHISDRREEEKDGGRGAARAIQATENEDGDLETRTRTMSAPPVRYKVISATEGVLAHDIDVCRAPPSAC